MNDALFASLSNYIERESHRASKVTGISNKTLSRTKAELEKVVLAPRTG